MDKHSYVSEHVVKMSGYIQRLNALECQISDNLAIDRVLKSLPDSGASRPVGNPKRKV
jgi:hypothetical protein